MIEPMTRDPKNAKWLDFSPLPEPENRTYQIYTWTYIWCVFRRGGRAYLFRIAYFVALCPVNGVLLLVIKWIFCVVIKLGYFNQTFSSFIFFISRIFSLLLSSLEDLTNRNGSGWEWPFLLEYGYFCACWAHGLRGGIKDSKCWSLAEKKRMLI